METMSQYEEKVWASLNEHWARRDNQRGIPNWASNALTKGGESAAKAARAVGGAVPDAVKKPVQNVGEAVTSAAVRPALESAVAILELVNEWCLELNNPKTVEKAARQRGVDVATFADLKQQDLKFCDRLLARNTLVWTSVGAVEGGAMGLLALVPVAGIPVAISADIFVIQVMSTAISARIAYSYGFDAKDPDEQEFIQRLVQRSFVTQAAKVVPLNETARAAGAIAGRQRWSANLRADHRLIAVLEKMMNQVGPAGSAVSVKSVAKALGGVIAS